MIILKYYDNIIYLYKRFDRGFGADEGLERLEIRLQRPKSPKLRHPWTPVELPTAMLGKIVVGQHFAGAIGAAGEPQSTIPGRPKLRTTLFFSK